MRQLFSSPFILPINEIQKFCGVFLVVMVVAGCGFQLRGNYTFPTALQQLYISPADPFAPLQKDIRRSLRRSGIAVLEQPQEHVAILTLTEPTFNEQVLATAANISTQRVLLTISFQYQVNLNNKILRPMTNIQLSREFSRAPNAPLSGGNERRLVQKELLQEGVNQLMHQLAAIKVQASKQSNANHS